MTCLYSYIIIVAKFQIHSIIIFQVIKKRFAAVVYMLCFL